jgi:uncharacterized membrane protein
MNKNRLEAFSDGVFAIVITLLILDIRLPEVDYTHLPQALIAILPRILAYVMSFAVIGLYWISHHNSFTLISRIDRPFLWMNILLLLLISFMPFPTSLMGKYPFTTIPILIYGLNLVATNITGYCMGLYIYYHKELASQTFTRQALRKQTYTYVWVNAAYVIAICISGSHPGLSYCIFGLTLAGIIFFVRAATQGEYEKP